MQPNDSDTNLQIFKAFLLGKHVTLKAFNIEATVADDGTYDVLQSVAKGKQSLIPDFESMLQIVGDADKESWKKRFESKRPERVAEERELAAAAIKGMTEFLRL